MKADINLASLFEQFKKTNHIELKIRVVKRSEEFLFTNYMKYKAISPFVVALAVGLSKCGHF